MKINIANVLVDNVTTEETVDAIDKFVRSGEPHYIVTPYSEFIVFAGRDSRYLEVLNQADLSLPDGIGILWAAKYLSVKDEYGSIVELCYSLLATLFSRSYARSVISERVSGSKLIWNIASLAAAKNYSMALVGGDDEVAVKSAVVLESKYPNLKINLAVSGHPFDDEMIKRISESNSDILCIAYQPPKQELWLAQNLHRLNVKAAIGLGGTFDYLAGKRISSPGLFTSLGLEWLWRLITQPWRIKRIWNALPVFISIVYKYKLNKSHE